MPVGECTQSGVGCEICLQPLVLFRTGHHANFTIKRDNMPGPKVVAVVPLASRSRIRPEVRIIRTGIRRMIIVVARRRSCACLMPSPGWFITLLKLSGGAIGVDVVTERSDRAVKVVEELRRRFILSGVAIRNVAGSEQHCTRRWWC